LTIKIIRKKFSEKNFQWTKIFMGKIFEPRSYLFFELNTGPPPTMEGHLLWDKSETGGPQKIKRTAFFYEMRIFKVVTF